MVKSRSLIVRVDEDRKYSCSIVLRLIISGVKTRLGGAGLQLAKSHSAGPDI